MGLQGSVWAMYPLVCSLILRQPHPCKISPASVPATRGLIAAPLDPASLSLFCWGFYAVFWFFLALRLNDSSYWEC